MKTLLWLFLLPGDLVRQKLGITIEEDGGLIRSFINMCFWGGGHADDRAEVLCLRSRLSGPRRS